MLCRSVAKKSIGDEGCIHFATALHTNHALTALNVASNAIAEAGITPLCQAVAMNTTLRHLECVHSTATASPLPLPLTRLRVRTAFLATS